MFGLKSKVQTPTAHVEIISSKIGHMSDVHVIDLIGSDRAWKAALRQKYPRGCIGSVTYAGALATVEIVFE